MDTLLLRIAAPLQSWGVNAKFDRRTSQKEPTKSAVIGMLAGALGRKRNQDISDLTEGLRFGTRTDQRGRHLVDFHIAKSEKSAYVTYRHYLSDAIFLVGLEGEANLILQIEEALRRPYYPLFLGRRSCPPEGEMILGIEKNRSLESCLEEFPRLVSRSKQAMNRREGKMAVFIEPKRGEKVDYFLQDQPISFDQRQRSFGYRGVREYFLDGDRDEIGDNVTDHDPLAVLGGSDVSFQDSIESDE